MLKLILGGLSGLSMPLNNGAPPDVAISSVDTGMILRSSQGHPKYRAEERTAGQESSRDSKAAFLFLVTKSLTI